MINLPNKKLTMEEFLFNHENLSKQLAEYTPPKFNIGVDAYNENSLAYCLGVWENQVFSVLLAKRMDDEKGFNEEVQNLAQYFGASIIKEE